jgi:glycosyltransferase involved in cell wall biosynthesis
MKESSVSILTAGRDKPYALGLASALIAAGTKFDFIGSNEVESAELRSHPQVNFLNLRGDQSVDAGALKKMGRVLVYYFRLLAYPLTARPKVFHILWNNKFEWLDRTVLMVYYRLLGKKICFTAHNVNVKSRDGGDSWWNRATLKFQYHRCDHVFLHTERMRQELVTQFDFPAERTSLIPFGINGTTPDTKMTGAEARQKLGLAASEKVALFFGNIAPYKGVEFLVEAFETVASRDAAMRLVIAGRPKGEEAYWGGLLEKINRSAVRGQISLKIEYVPDAETEIYFKAADVLVLPYTHIFQSGVLFLGYNYGLPIVATDVGQLRDDIIEGQTGFMCPPKDAAALAATLQKFFGSELFAGLKARRQEIRAFANDRYSWSKVAQITTAVYHRLVQKP